MFDKAVIWFTVSFTDIVSTALLYHLEASENLFNLNKLLPIFKFAKPNITYNIEIQVLEVDRKQFESNTLPLLGFNCKR
jgi:hypothetical protein